MLSGLVGLRLIGGLAIVAGVLVATASAGDAQEVGTITIYTTECPPGYTGDDFYGDCYSNPVEGLRFSGEQGKSGEAPVVIATDASGFVTLPLYGGVTIVSEGRPPGISAYFVYCVKADGSVVDFQYTGDTFGILLDEEGGDYAPGDDLRCDWYNVPAADGDSGGRAGTISIYRATCPPGYVPDYPMAYYDDCFDHPAAGVQFIVREAGTDVNAGFSTGPDGNTMGSLPLSNPGTIVVAELPEPIDEPASYQDYVVFCVRNGSEEVVVDYGQAGVMDIVFEASPEDAIGCDWFYVPPATGGEEPLEGSLTIYAAACPAGYEGDDYYQDCFDNPYAGADFFASARIGVIDEGTTDADGVLIYGFADLGVHEPPDLGEGEAGISIGVAHPDEFAVFCSKNGGDAVEVFTLVDGGPQGLPGVGIPGEDVEPGDAIRCDWFLLPSGSDPGDGTTLTIYAAACPDGYDGDDYYADCYANPVENLTFGAFRWKEDFFVSATTDADGFVTLQIPPSTIYDGILFGQSPAVEVFDMEPPFAVACVDGAGDPVAVGYNMAQLDPGGDSFSAAIEDLPAGDVHCDWFLLGSDTPSDDDDGQGITVLPNTGAGMAEDMGRSPAVLVAGFLALICTLGGAATVAQKLERAPKAVHHSGLDR